VGPVNFWPYNEDGVKQGDFTEQFRFPIVSNPYPAWSYITAVVVSEEPWHGLRPTDTELRMVASFHQEYIEHWYRDSWKALMRTRPFDIDGNANGRYLIKHRNGGWGYRLRTWRFGPAFVPQWDDEPSDLVTVLDRVHRWGDTSLSPRWLEWKAAHPEVFGKAVRDAR